MTSPTIAAIHLWSCYQQTCFAWTDSPLLLSSFAIITAWDPGSVPRPLPLNIAAQHSLITELQALKILSMPIQAGNQDFSYQESSLAVACQLQQGIDLAEKYGQNGIYFVEMDWLFLYPCGEFKRHFEPEMLCRFSHRVKVGN